MPRGDNYLSIREEAALNSYGAHVTTCPKCLPHLGHVPYGLCPIGLSLLLAMDQQEDE